MRLKDLRKSKGLTQKQVSEMTNIPIRTYKNYENELDKENSIKYLYIMEKLEQYGFIDEEHGVLSLKKIQQICKSVFDNYKIEYAYLFGSYSKGKANEKSDVDLFIYSNLTGLDYFALVEDLREQLKKKIDLVNMKQKDINSDLINEVLKDGIKIYG